MTQLIVDGTIAPWLWNGFTYYQAPLLDIGLFGPAGTVLTGLPFQIVWDDPGGERDPGITAALTINGTTITLGPAPPPFYSQYSLVQDIQQSITIANFNPYNNLPGNIQLTSNLPSANPAAPHGVGGVFDLIGPAASCNSGNWPLFGEHVDPACNQTLDGFFYVNNTESVPGPVVGDGISALAVALLIVVACCVRKKGNRHVATQGVQDGC